MFKQTLILLLVSVTLLGCRPEDYKLVRGPQNAGAPQTRLVEQTVEQVNNCGDGGDTIYKTPSQIVGTSETVVWEVAVNAGIELSAGFLQELEAGFQATYGREYMTSAQTGTGWQLAARPGEKIEYILEWSEIWQPGNIVVGAGSQTRTVGYRYRKAIRSEILSKTLLACADDPPAAGETVLPTATPTPPAAVATVEPAQVEPQITPQAEPQPESQVEPPTDPGSAVLPAPRYQVIVTGVGFPIEALKNPAQRRASAIRAAEMDGKRRLAEWLAGADLESVTVVKNAQVEIDMIRQEVSMHLKGTQTLSQLFDEITEQATVEMTLLLTEGEP